MKTLLTLFVLLSLIGCSKKTPAHPDAGLAVYSHGTKSATCGFYIDSSSEIPVSLEVRKFSFTEGGHKVEFEWEESFGDVADHYIFDITLDGVRTRRTLYFDGHPVVLMEKPFKVILQKNQ